MSDDRKYRLSENKYNYDSNKKRGFFSRHSREVKNHHKYTPLHKYKHEDYDDYTDKRRRQIQTVYIIFAIIVLVKVSRR